MPVDIILGSARSFLIECNFQDTALNKFEFWIYGLTTDPE